jgi:hypothetical protein
METCLNVVRLPLSYKEVTYSALVLLSSVHLLREFIQRVRGADKIHYKSQKPKGTDYSSVRQNCVIFVTYLRFVPTKSSVHSARNEILVCLCKVSLVNVYFEPQAAHFFTSFQSQN